MENITKYPLYNSKEELIGTCELDNTYNGGMHSTDIVLMCEDLNGMSYEISAWGLERIINLVNPNLPRTYGRTL